MIKAGIIGGSGYTGGELMRLLAGHPAVEVACITSRRLEGKPVSDTHRHLRNFTDMRFQNISTANAAGMCDVVFTAVPHGSAMDIVPALLDGGAKVIDLSADYRLPADIFEQTYGLKHRAPRTCPYGLTELHPEVSDSMLVSNPGCYPTGAVLAAAPLVAAGLVDHAVFDSKSGISGAGAEPTEVSHYPNMAENIQAYKLTNHRHAAEIRQELNRLDRDVRVNFTPHVIPSVRGILTTAHLFLKEQVDKEKVREIYSKFYQKKPFIRLIDGIPMLGPVRGSNFCDIGFEVDSQNERVVVVSAIDNLVKGASGQAVQNMNLMFDQDETAGLWRPAVSP